MAEAAKARGYQYLAITDHSKSQVIANGLTAERLLKHVQAIHKAGEKINARRARELATEKGVKEILVSSEEIYGRYLAEDMDIYFDDISDAAERIWDLLENQKDAMSRETLATQGRNSINLEKERGNQDRLTNAAKASSVNSTCRASNSRRLSPLPANSRTALVPI